MTMDRPKVTSKGDITPIADERLCFSTAWTETLLSMNRCKRYPMQTITGMTKAKVRKGEMGMKLSITTDM